MGYYPGMLENEKRLAKERERIILKIWLFGAGLLAVLVCIDQVLKAFETR